MQHGPFLREELAMDHRIMVGFVFACLVLAAAGTAAAGEFVPLFDGKTLNGWHTAPGGSWEVKEGVIVGTSPATERRHGMLLSDKQYGDFVLRLKFKSLKGNSGLYFRAERVQQPVTVHGFQAEIAPSGPVGGLYETGGRAWVVQPDAELVKRCFKPGDWNEMTVTAQGKNVRVELNGVTTAEVKDDPGRTAGYFGLQLHGGNEMHVEFKDIEIQTGSSP
jgi:hypothetical protein